MARAAAPGRERAALDRAVSMTAGLSTEQAPPLSIPAAFFLTAPVAMALAGGLLVTILLVIYLLTLKGRTARVQKIVAERTGGLVPA